MLRYRQVTFLANNVEAVFSEQVNQSAPCLPDVDWPRAFTARNTIDDVIWSAIEMPRDLNLSSWWWKWGWLDNVRTGTTDWFVGKVPGCWAGWPEEIRCLFSFIWSLDIPNRNFWTRIQFQNSTQLQITISLFYVAAKHPSLKKAVMLKGRFIYSAVKRHLPITFTFRRKDATQSLQY